MFQPILGILNPWTVRLQNNLKKAQGKDRCNLKTIEAMNLFLFAIMHSVPDYYASICGSNSIVFRLHLSLPCAYFKLFCNPTVQGFNIPTMGWNICIWRYYLNFSATSFQVTCNRKNCVKRKKTIFLAM